MPVEDFNGMKIFEGLENSFKSVEMTTELFQNNAVFFSWLLIFAIFFGVFILGLALVTYLGMRTLKPR
ncbi:MAG: hypothetical protein KAU95_02030 [Candidatus Aenigmarchaeota archaeon]|nr:hypothetical protein [Candidatus Aenigmarchaeota archaeon]